MESNILAKDSTIRTIAGSVTVEYVRRVLDKMWECERGFGDVQVAIGLVASSVSPNYLIWAVMDLDTGEGVTCGAFNGKTHREMTESKLLQERWSHVHMSLKEVGELIRDMRYSARGRT
jgi:hypothetical protein